MSKSWIVSITITLVIILAGIIGMIIMHHQIPKNLDKPSTILASGTENFKVNKDNIGEGTKELKEIIQESQKKVVKIELTNGSIGSGFLFNEKGDIVTNAHVVEGVKEVNITTSDERMYDGVVIGISEDIDVAVVRVEGLQSKEPLKVQMEKAEIGDEVLALGSPLGLDNTVTNGIISGIDRDLDLPPYHYENIYQISAPIAPGNSGGPLLDRKTGEVLGINSAASDVGNIGFSIPITDVLSLIEGWVESPMTTLPGVD